MSEINKALTVLATLSKGIELTFSFLDLRLW